MVLKDSVADGVVVAEWRSGVVGENAGGENLSTGVVVVDVVGGGGGDVVRCVVDLKEDVPE